MKGIIAVLLAVIACAGFNVTSDLKLRNNDVLQSLVVYTFSCFFFALLLHTLRWYYKAPAPDGLPVSFFPSADLFWYLILMGLFIFIANFGVTTGYKYKLSAQSIMMMLTLVPVFATFISSIFIRGEISLRQVIGYFFGVVTVWLIAYPSK